MDKDDPPEGGEHPVLAALGLLLERGYLLDLVPLQLNPVHPPRHLPHIVQLAEDLLGLRLGQVSRPEGGCGDALDYPSPHPQAGKLLGLGVAADEDLRLFRLRQGHAQHAAVLVEDYLRAAGQMLVQHQPERPQVRPGAVEGNPQDLLGGVITGEERLEADQYALGQRVGQIRNNKLGHVIRSRQRFVPAGDEVVGSRVTLHTVGLIEHPVCLRHQLRGLGRGGVTLGLFGGGKAIPGGRVVETADHQSLQRFARRSSEVRAGDQDRSYQRLVAEVGKGIGGGRVIRLVRGEAVAGQVNGPRAQAVFIAETQAGQGVG